MERAFSPFVFDGTTTWGVAPGWNGGGPLALSVLDRVWGTTEPVE